MNKEIINEQFCQERIALNPGVRLEELKFEKCPRLITGFIMYEDGFMRPVCDRCREHIDKVMADAVEAVGIPFDFYE